ncbi:MAG: DNA cytosine methyltransferase [Methanomicrobiales archaeon]|nr:DNA cytosine methyltransferase [Methanomicrobiales archaeon]
MVKKAISLFSGCGGCSLGLKNSGFAIPLAVDIDTDACKTYSYNIGSTPLCADLSKTSVDALLDHAQLDMSDVDLIVGGPPCQGFSSAGSKDWDDPRNALLRRFVEIVAEIRSPWFVMENVEGLLTARGGYYFIEAITRLLEAGYWIRAEKLYMERYGLPQKRKRVLVVGNLEQCLFSFPDASHRELKQLTLTNLKPYVSILDAIGDLPSPIESSDQCYNHPPTNAYQSMLRVEEGNKISHHHVKKLNKLYQQRIQALKEGQTMKNLPVELQHASFNKRAYRRVMDGTPCDKRGGAPSGLKRLVGSQPSLTITSAASAEFVHPTENRLLSLRECARIQSFPDWYKFKGSWGSIATQIGNAVPPLVMQKLAAHIRESSKGRYYDSYRGRWLGINASKATSYSPALAKMLSELEERTNAFTQHG